MKLTMSIAGLHPQPLKKDYVVRLFCWVSFILLIGCASHPRIETMVHESPEGKVFLKEFSDPSFQASHPRTLQIHLVEEVLAGLHIQEQKTFLESALTDNAQAVPVFTYSEVHFLAPLLTSGLEQATPGEAVHFSLDSSVSGRKFDIVGQLFVSRQHLTFLLTQYGLATTRTSLSRPSRSFDRSKRWVMSYRPSSVMVSSNTESQVNEVNSGQGSIVINLEHLRSFLDVKNLGNRGTDSPPLKPIKPGSQVRPTGDHDKSPMEEEIRQLRRSIHEQHERLEQLERQIQEDSPATP